MDVDRSSIISIQQMPPNTLTEKKSWSKDKGQISIIQVLEAPINTEDGKLSDKTQDDVNSSYDRGYWYLLHVITILIASSLSLVPQTMIPRYNEIYYPEYQYQNFINKFTVENAMCFLDYKYSYLYNSILLQNKMMLKYVRDCCNE